MGMIEPRPGALRIIVDRLATVDEARAIAQQILDTIPAAQRMPRAGKGWMTCHKCGSSLGDRNGHSCYRLP